VADAHRTVGHVLFPQREVCCVLVGLKDLEMNGTNVYVMSKRCFYQSNTYCQLLRAINIGTLPCLNRITFANRIMEIGQWVIYNSHHQNRSPEISFNKCGNGHLTIQKVSSIRS
jgi:hypothetical protein